MSISRVDKPTGELTHKQGVKISPSTLKQRADGEKGNLIAQSQNALDQYAPGIDPEGLALYNQGGRMVGAQSVLLTAEKLKISGTDGAGREFSLEYVRVSMSMESRVGVLGMADQYQPLELAELQELGGGFTDWSPEAVAGRILAMAENFLGMFKSREGEGASADAQSGFLENMRGAIQKGFDEAFEILGVLPGQVAGEISETHKLVMDGLDRLIADLLAPQAEKPTEQPASEEA
jgi:hypothetical protein